MPKDIREHLLRENLCAVLQRASTAEEKRRLSIDLLNGALALETDEIGQELRDQLIKASFELSDGLTASCAHCELAFWTNEMVDVNGKLLCKACSDGGMFHKG